MRITNYISIFVFALCLVRSAIAQSSAAAPPQATNMIVRTSEGIRSGVTTVPDYQIGADDILAITVWKEPDLCRTVPVRPDGKITMPLLGDLQASGRTPQRLQQEIQEGLTAYISVPQVTVTVQEVRSLKFNIVGQIAKPGSYSLSESTTVLDAIAQAGGIGIYAKSNAIYVLRQRPDGSSIQLPFHYKQVLKGTNLSQNVRLQPRDTVVVP
jgi:polysaccharide export outer membrane protein